MLVNKDYHKSGAVNGLNNKYSYISIRATRFW